VTEDPERYRSTSIVTQLGVVSVELPEGVDASTREPLILAMRSALETLGGDLAPYEATK
jgi:hypothetical protein